MHGWRLRLRQVKRCQRPRSRSLAGRRAVRRFIPRRPARRSNFNCLRKQEVTVLESPRVQKNKSGTPDTDNATRPEDIDLRSLFVVLIAQALALLSGASWAQTEQLSSGPWLLQEISKSSDGEKDARFLRITTRGDQNGNIEYEILDLESHPDQLHCLGDPNCIGILFRSLANCSNLTTAGTWSGYLTRSRLVIGEPSRKVFWYPSEPGTIGYRGLAAVCRGNNLKVIQDPIAFAASALK
jgi:hypothetical protein